MNEIINEQQSLKHLFYLILNAYRKKIWAPCIGHGLVDVDEWWQVRPENNLQASV
jgi:hypothetical protein